MRSRIRTIGQSLRAPHVRPHDLSFKQLKKVTEKLEVPLERSCAPLLADTDPRPVGAGMEAREAASRTFQWSRFKKIGPRLAASSQVLEWLRLRHRDDSRDDVLRRSRGFHRRVPQCIVAR